MSGVEVAGLVLGAFPIVIQIIDSYRGVLAGRDTDFLLETLRNNELIFRNSIRLMLRSIIPATELDVLLENLGGDVWEDVSLNARMSQVGQDADAIIQNLKVIYATLSKLKKKLPVSCSAVTAHEPSAMLNVLVRVVMLMQELLLYAQS